MSRNWNVVEFSGDTRGETLVHDVPPLVVRRTVLLVPEIQTTSFETGERPRNCWLLFVGLRCHVRLGLDGV